MPHLTRTCCFHLPILFLFIASSALAQTSDGGKKTHTPVSQALYDSIVHMDSLLFNSFNNQDLETQKCIFATDLEFYHDKGGLMHYQQVIESTRNLFAQNNGLKRTLIPGSMEVYPIPGYGAMQTGMHCFCHVENGKDDCGTFRFVHIWQSAQDGWKLTRVISYDH
jgi:hypothetical protein